MYYTYNKIEKEVYDYCITNKIVDAALIAKWKKPGYERLCSTYVINPRNYKFGTVSICRVPKQSLAQGTEIEDPTTGCRGCASGSSHNIFDNKYGQYLAAIQVAREERLAAKQAALQKMAGRRADSDEEDEEEDEDDEDDEPVGAADGSSGKKREVVWADPAQAGQLQQLMTEDMVGSLSADARREGMMAAPHAKRQRND